jgi:hypothetical protein
VALLERLALSAWAGVVWTDVVAKDEPSNDRIRSVAILVVRRVDVHVVFPLQPLLFVHGLLSICCEEGCSSAAK